MKNFKRIIRLGIGAVLLALAVTSPAAFASDGMVDYCLDSSGNMREGVDIVAYFEKNGEGYTIQKDETPAMHNDEYKGYYEGTPGSIITGKSAHGFFSGGFGFGWGGISGGKTYIQLDLGAVRDINKIVYAPVNQYGDAQSYWRVTTIYLSNDPTFKISEEVCFQRDFTPGENTSFEFSKEETKRYRYVRLKTSGVSDSVVCAAKHLEVKGYCDDFFGNWSIPEVTSAGDYSITMPVEHFKGVKEYTVQVAGYDANNKLTAFSSERASAENGVITGNISVPEGTVNLTAALLNSAKNMVYATEASKAPDGLFTNEDVTLTGSDFADFTSSDNSVTVKAKGDAEDYITVYAVKNVDKSKTAEEYFEEIGESLNGSVHYVAVGKSGTGISFTVPFTDTGIYYLRAVKSNASGSESLYYRYSMVTDAEKEVFIDNVFTTDGSNWDEIVARYADELELLTDGNVLSIAEIKAEDFENTLIRLRNAMFESEAEKTLGNVTELIKAAVIVKRMEDGNFDAAESDIKKATELSQFIGEYKSFENYEKVIKDLLKSDLEPSELKDVLQHSAMLSFIQDGTASEIASALEKYGSDLGIDISDCDKNGVQLSRVAARIDNQKASDYFGDGMKTAFAKAIADERAYLVQISNNKKPSSSGGSSGGGGGGAVYAPVIKQDNKNEDNTNQGTKDDKKEEIKISFSDLGNHPWAKESILKLAEDKVINGYTDGTFKPDGNVSRAEFVKMLVTALNITVNEKKEMHFADVNGKAWYYPYIAIAYSVGIVNGVDGYNFGTDNSISRQDLSVMLCNAMLHKGKGVAMTEEKCTEYIPDYAKEAFNVMIENGILTGYSDGTYKPGDFVTRAEAAVILCRTAEFINGGEI